MAGWNFMPYPLIWEVPGQTCPDCTSWPGPGQVSTCTTTGADACPYNGGTCGRFTQAMWADNLKPFWTYCNPKQSSRNWK